MTHTPVIEVHDLWFSYNGNPVLAEVNLMVQQGDFMAIIGPNGGGKSTLLKLMLGLLAPDKGSIRVFGEQPGKAAPRIGYVPQEIGINTTFPISVEDVVLMGRIRGSGGWYRFSRHDKALSREYLERVGMWEYRDRRVGELSGGQRQRVYLARALVSRPQILFLDEPTASVDTQGQTDLYAFLHEINESVTVIVVSHDLSIVSGYVKSVTCVNRRLIHHGAPEITGDMLKMAYHCPVELIAHGLPHRVLQDHRDE